MSNNKTTSKPETTAASTEEKGPKLRKLGKKLASHVPYIKWHVGLVVCGRIIRKYENDSGFGVKQNLQLELVDPCEYTDAEGEVHSLPVGEALNIGATVGLNTAMTLEVGNIVQLYCTGRKDLGKGRKPAWEFDVTYE